MSVGSSAPPQASSSNGRSSARAKIPRKSSGVLISTLLCVCWAALGRRGRILAHVGGLPASAPGTAESMAGPFYPPGVLPPVRLRRCRWLAVPRGSADGKKTPARGRGPKPHSSGRGVITLRKERCCLRSSTAGGRGPFRPPVTSGGQKTGFAKRGLTLGLGPAWLGARWAADVAERTEDMGPRFLCAPRRIYLAMGRVSRGLTGRTGDHLS